MIPHESIERNGDALKNYLILMTAQWCRYCPAQKAVLNNLKDQGYITYNFDVDKFPDVAKKMATGPIPLTVIMDKGHEVKRFEGGTSANTLKKYLRKRSEQ